MSVPLPRRMTADEFIPWAMQQPKGQRYELADGEIIAMAAERVIHVRSKFRIARQLHAAVDAAGLQCETFIDGMAVRVDDHTIYEPDALVRCGPPLGDNMVEILDPLIVVEVVSPSTRNIDAGIKLDDYFRIPSVVHYLIVRADKETIIHHRRDTNGLIATSIVRDGNIQLDPPGIALTGLFK